MDIKDFLLARITEDEVRATMRDWHQSDCPTIPGESGYAYPCDCGVPERMAAECTAKRAIVDRHRRDPDVQHMIYGDIYPCTECGDADDSPMEWPCPTMRTLATVYADHPDYQPEWAQEASQP